MIPTKILINLLLAFLAMQIFTAQMLSQQYPGFEYEYDNDSNHDRIGNGDRILRRQVNFYIKSADTSMTETTVGNINIKIYPNHTKVQLTLIIVGLKNNDLIL